MLLIDIFLKRVKCKETPEQLYIQTFTFIKCYFNIVLRNGSNTTISRQGVKCDHPSAHGVFNPYLPKGRIWPILYFFPMMIFWKIKVNYVYLANFKLESGLRIRVTILDRRRRQRVKSLDKILGYENFWGHGWIILDQGGITCGAIDEPRKSSKAIDERVIINFRDKNVVIARFRDKYVVIARFRDKNVVIARFRDKTAYVWGLRYWWDPSLSRKPLPHFPHFMPQIYGPKK